MIQKHKYLTLDAIRGVAAIFVFIQHGPFLFGGLKFEHAYLAVDLFFVMSGFVIASAYTENMASGKISVIDFLKIRAIRLYPLYFLALIISVLYTLQHDFRHHDPLDLINLLFQGLFGIFMIPYPSYEGYPFPLNIPAWSIFFELVANIIYAFSNSYLTKKVLLYVIGFTAAMLIFFVVLNKNINFGWKWGMFLGGYPRVVFSFYVGIMLYQLRTSLQLKHIESNWLSILMLLTIAVLLVIPLKLNPTIYDLVAVLIVFPVVIFTATYIEPKSNNQLGRFYALLGLSSYGIYIFQFSFQSIIAAVFVKSNESNIFVGLISILVLFLLSILLDSFYDQPIRSWLKRKLLRTRKVISN